MGRFPGTLAGMLYFPSIPEVPAEQLTSGRTYLRYEDISQDGRLSLASIPHALGAIIWRNLLSTHPAVTALFPQGIVTVLSRLSIRNAETPLALSISKPLVGKGGYELAHTRNQQGEVNRLMLNMWLSLCGEKGHGGPEQADTGAIVPVGSLFAEHVFTRPFGRKEDRRVARFAADGLPEVPPRQWQWRPPEQALALPDGAVALEDELSADAMPIAFGLHHTDKNQHVNSLMYPRLFEDAALRRFVTLGRSTRLLATQAEVTYRKPCFAGEIVVIMLRAYEQGGRLGAAGCFVSRDEAQSPSAMALARPRCYVNMLFTE